MQIHTLTHSRHCRLYAAAAAAAAAGAAAGGDDDDAV